MHHDVLLFFQHLLFQCSLYNSYLILQPVDMHQQSDKRYQRHPLCIDKHAKMWLPVPVPKCKDICNEFSRLVFTLQISHTLRWYLSHIRKHTSPTPSECVIGCALCVMLNHRCGLLICQLPDKWTGSKLFMRAFRWIQFSLSLLRWVELIEMIDRIQ